MDDPAPIIELEGNEEYGDEAMKYIHSGTTDANNSRKLQEDEGDLSSGPAKAREDGLITLSGLPPAHWKNLFHLELVKQRNKPKEPPKKPPSAPFFLQWRPGVNELGEPSKNPEIKDHAEKLENDEEWDAVWSDDDDDENGKDSQIVRGLSRSDDASKRSRDETKDKKQDISKRRKIRHYRSHLATLLEESAGKKCLEKTRFQPVTDYVGTLGPSAIDVSLSSLCNGSHDLEDGLALLTLASRWLLEACRSRERFDAVNAYLHRFLHLHSNTLAGVDEVSLAKNDNGAEGLLTEEDEEMKRQREELALNIKQLKEAQKSGSEVLQGEMQNTLCLLRHFSRMV
jgi:U3 small nucleolar RNA-associated protein 21